MFKWFDWSNEDSVPFFEKWSWAKDISQQEKDRKESLGRAKMFAEDFVGEYRHMKQFFDISPKIGKYGLCEKVDNRTTVVRFQDHHFDGVSLVAYVNHEGITGFEFTE